MRIPQILLLALLIFLPATGCDDGPNALTAPEESLDFDCFNPSVTSLECSGSVVTVHPIDNFSWQATGQQGQNGRAATNAAWDYTRFCAVQTKPTDVTVRLTVFLQGGDQLGPVTHLYQVCLSDAQAASTRGGQLDPTLVAMGYGSTVDYFIP
jgi:hypothetical protein